VNAGSRNPFPGLRPFDADESDLYFGREEETSELLQRLRQTRFVVVLGEGGSGKSSLVRAGLVPALEGGFLSGGGSGWQIVSARPGADPLKSLVHTLDRSRFSRAGTMDAAIGTAFVEATLRRGSLGLVEFVRESRLTDGQNFLLVVDQFEELFRFEGPHREEWRDRAAAFVKLLLNAAESPHAPIYVVVTMRASYLGACAEFYGLPEAINRGQYLLPRMTREQLRRAIAGPAAVEHVSVSNALLNRLLNEGADHRSPLPLLQHALMRTWSHWTERGDGSARPIEVMDYDAVGGLPDALSRHADEVFHSLGDARLQRIVGPIFKALTQSTGGHVVRRPTTARDLCAIVAASTHDVALVVEGFSRADRAFLTSHGPLLADDAVIDIAHESLITHWARLQTWVEEESESARIYRRLAETADLLERGQERLLTGPWLELARRWRDAVRPTAAWASRYHPGFTAAMRLLDRSLRMSKARTVSRWLVIALMAAAILTLGLLLRACP
jgi:hypothetical protein